MVGRNIIYACLLVMISGDSIGAPQYESCPNGIIDWIDDGYCDDENNNEMCLYDGGDCCSCTCTNALYECGFGGFSCVDPDVTGLEPYICVEPPPINKSCPAGLQNDEWIVENTKQARALADAVRCSGGLFNVSWKGRVVVDKTIWVANGTILNMTNGDASSAIIGDGETRLIVVVNASLYLQNLVVGNGKAIYGGAIAASHSRLIFERIRFYDNNATGGGGALFLSNGSIATFGEDSAFFNNTAQSGGTIYVMGGSNASWTGNTTFSNNRAISGSGGALYVTDGSSVGWTAASKFMNNSAGLNGGALYVRGFSNVVWTVTSHFFANTASFGGALLLWNGSTAAWTARSFFSTNTAETSGGAVYVTINSTAAWSEESFFSDNSARFGGSLFLDRSTATWSGESFFSVNHASISGGVIILTDGSTATWKGESFFHANSAGYQGGALYLVGGCTATWRGKSFFHANSAGYQGGALQLFAVSTTVWSAESYFSANSAVDSGGALSIRDSSTATWSVKSFFFASNCSNSGGAVHLNIGGTAKWGGESYFIAKTARRGGGVSLTEGSDVEWSADSFFFNNSVLLYGGALSLTGGSTASWGAISVFFANRVESTYHNENHGGALFLEEGSTASWSAESSFFSNNAQSDGGAVYAGTSANLSWNEDVLFVNNGARNGGAIFVTDGSTAERAGKTNFTSNTAKDNGGAVGSRPLSARMDSSLVVIKGATIFSNNTCGANGGAMALINALAVSFETEKTIFFNNLAGVSGGAVFVTGTVIGTVFTNVLFVENSAPIGGGVHATGSGTVITIGDNENQEENPTKFVGCKFVGNFAFGTGGAVDSASGKDFFQHMLFEGNKARVGGALRLEGKTSIDDCSFIDNASNLGGGPAVSNVGYVSNITGVYFNGNVFNCEPETFLDFKGQDPFEVLCDGCQYTCVGCSFGEEQKSPTCTSLADVGIEHATSGGGTTTIEGLYIHEGYWRATSTSTNVNKCFNTKACRGGTTGALNYCISGYEGPYCSICSKNSVSTVGFICRECTNSTVGIAVAFVATVLITSLGLAMGSYLVSPEETGAGQGIVDRLTRRIPMQSVKIIIVVWQILTQFASVANVTFPNVYQKLLNAVGFFNFDLVWVVSAGCFLDIDFHDRLIWATTTPLVVMGLLGITYLVSVRRNRESLEAVLNNARQKHMSMTLLITFLVYSSVSSVVFQTFACEDLDDGKNYLRADYTIECDSPKYRAFQTYAGLMILVYPVGIPAFYAALLFCARPVLRDEAGREESSVVRSTSGLWKPYKPQRFYYEVIECSRRNLLAGFLVFFYPNSAAQVAVALAIAVFFVFVSEALDPYRSQWDAWISRLGHVIVFLTIFLSLLLKVNVPGESYVSQKTFEVILVAGHGCMLLAVVVEVVILAMLLRRGNQQEDPRPRRRRSSNNTWRIQASPGEDDGCKHDL